MPPPGLPIDGSEWILWAAAFLTAFYIFKKVKRLDIKD